MAEWVPELQFSVIQNWPKPNFLAKSQYWPVFGRVRPVFLAYYRENLTAVENVFIILGSMKTQNLKISKIMKIEVLDPKKMAKTEFSCKIGTLPGIR